MAEAVVTQGTVEPRQSIAPSETISIGEFLREPQRTIEQLNIEEPGENATTAENEMNYPKGADLVAICAALTIILISIGLDISIVAVTIPALSDEFKSIADIAWYSTALRLVMCSFMFLFGKAYTLFSVKHVFLLSLVVFVVGNVICTAAITSVMFIVGRAICGFGCSGLIGGTFVIFTHSFPLRKRPLVGGIAGAIEIVAGLAAPVLGGAFITGWTWRACFGINVPLGVIGSVIIIFFLKLHPNPDEALPLKEKIQKLDLLGTAFFAPAMVCLLLALQWGGVNYAWNSAQVIALFVLFAVLLAGFFAVQWKTGDKASLPIRILKNRNLLAGAFFALCTNATISVVEYYLSIYFQGVRGYTAVMTGVFNLPLLAGMGIAAPLAGAVTTWIGYYFQNMYLAAVLASVSAGVLTTVDVDTNLALVLSMLGVLGFAFGIGIQAPQVAAQTILPLREVSIGLAIVNFGSQMGPVLFLATGAALFTNRLSDEIRIHSPMTNVTSIENMGLTDIRNNLGGEALRGVLTGYNEALVQTLYLPLSLACVSIFGCVIMERLSVKKKQ